MQTLLMFLGVLVVVIICCVDLGGLGNVWRIANEGNRIEFFNLDSSPFVRHTFWSTFVLGFYMMVGDIGLNQAVYQRFASVSSLRIAKRLSIFLVGIYCLWTVFFLSGLVAFATYSTCDPLTSGKITKPDQILPFLVTDKLSHLTGLAGVFVSAVYGGVLRSLPFLLGILLLLFPVLLVLIVLRSTWICVICVGCFACYVDLCHLC
ncbi:sodium-coupled monocarboxylate transporter 2-like [Homarus americanus]|uniref:sodium-coupled monocarboxylate transporter 2-like n=1 Tax=Homarus americanus TaxID=6706 RepID=UPI001C45F486|nr:sodium-coupled monocarboxylate transporter 2-like [Homarus americanus]